MSSERNYGIDLLKIVSMFMVVVLHVLGHGGVLEHALDLTLNDTVAWFIEILCYPAVNLFALTTGYLCINKNFKYKNIINLWFLVLFYCVSYTLIFKGVDFISLIKAIFPVSNNAYWYFSAYFCFIFFIPFINKFLNSVDEFEHRKLICFILFIMCGVGLISNIFGNDVIRISAGYSPIWLMGLYVIGAYIKKYNFKLKNYSKKFYFLIYIFISLVALLSRIVILKVPIFDKFFSSEVLIQYDAFTIVISALSLFLLFIKIRVNNIYKKVLSFFSGLSFSVYLVHEHVLTRDLILNNKYIHFCRMPVLQMVFMILFTAVVIYVVCTIIDIFRYYLFKFLRVEKLSEWLDKKIVLMLTKKG